MFTITGCVHAHYSYIYSHVSESEIELLRFQTTLLPNLDDFSLTKTIYINDSQIPQTDTTHLIILDPSSPNFYPYTQTRNHTRTVKLHEIKSPAHTQARMAAAEAGKAAKTAKPVVEVVQVVPPTQLEHKPRSLPGHMNALHSDGRRAILESSERVAIAYGTLENPLILGGKVNMAMLRHCKYFFPHALSSTLPTCQTSRTLLLCQVANNCQISPPS